MKKVGGEAFCSDKKRHKRNSDFENTNLILKISGLFLGVVIFGLLMELNSVFLHSRSLLNLSVFRKVLS